MLEIYKKGQGTTARWIAAVALLGLAVLGCYALQAKLSESESAWITQKLNLGIINLSLSVIIAAGAFVLAAVAVGFVVNHRRLVDYLINSEAELRKVAWPTRPELKRQTIVVLVSMAFFGILLFLADLLFGALHQLLYYGKFV